MFVHTPRNRFLREAMVTYIVSLLLKRFKNIEGKDRSERYNFGQRNRQFYTGGKVMSLTTLVIRAILNSVVRAKPADDRRIFLLTG